MCVGGMHAVAHMWLADNSAKSIVYLAMGSRN